MGQLSRFALPWSDKSERFDRRTSNQLLYHSNKGDADIVSIRTRKHKVYSQQESKVSLPFLSAETPTRIIIALHYEMKSR